MVVGIILLGISIGIYISAKIGEAGIYAIMMTLAEKLHIEVKIIRIIIDIILAGLGFLIGNRIEVATIIAIVVNGPIINATILIIKRLKNRNFYAEDVTELSL